MLIQSFLATSEGLNKATCIGAASNSCQERREAVQICVIGSLDGTAGIIYDLHRRDFAEVNEWSKPQPTGKPGEYIRLLRRYILHRQ